MLPFILSLRKGAFTAVNCIAILVLTRVLVIFYDFELFNLVGLIVVGREIL